MMRPTLIPLPSPKCQRTGIHIVRFRSFCQKLLWYSRQVCEKIELKDEVHFGVIFFWYGILLNFFTICTVHELEDPSVIILCLGRAASSECTWGSWEEALGYSLWQFGRTDICHWSGNGILRNDNHVQSVVSFFLKQIAGHSWSSASSFSSDSLLKDGELWYRHLE